MRKNYIVLEILVVVLIIMGITSFFRQPQTVDLDSSNLVGITFSASHSAQAESYRFDLKRESSSRVLLSAWCTLPGQPQSAINLSNHVVDYSYWNAFIDCAAETKLVQAPLRSRGIPFLGFLTNRGGSGEMTLRFSDGSSRDINPDNSVREVIRVLFIDMVSQVEQGKNP